MEDTIIKNPSRFEIDAVARDILRDKIEGKGASRRTAYRRIEEAEKLKLIKFQKGECAYELY